MRKILMIVGAVVIVLVVGAVAVWYFVLKSDPEPRTEIEETPVVEGGPIDGTYAVQPGGTDSFVGYRVQEQFAGAVVESTATGRTSDVEGTLTVSNGGLSVDEVEVTANLTTLTSDREMRDARIRTLGLESEMFPEATFVLTRPMETDTAPKRGETVNATAIGDFTLHGVTKRVRIPVEGRWDGRSVQVVGNLPIVFADYGMDAPNIGGFVSVRDEGEMEFQLFFREA
ncbi:MAG: YceI family protein [Acidimicrobiia bacterium]